MNEVTMGCLTSRSLLEKNEESIKWDSNFVFDFVSALAILTENGKSFLFFVSLKSCFWSFKFLVEDLKIIDVVCSLCEKVGEPYLVESCAWILLKHSEKRPEQDMTNLSKKIISPVRVCYATVILEWPNYHSLKLS